MATAEGAGQVPEPPEGPVTREIRAEAARRGPWSLLYKGFDPGQEGLREALCTTGNGYFATRGAAPESRADGVHYPGTYAAGVFNRLRTEIAGEQIANESMVNLPNWLPLSFRIERGPWFDLAEVDLLAYEQELDLRRGVLTRRIRFRDGAGRCIGVVQRRFTSMADPHLAALETTIHAYDWSGEVEIRSGLDADVENAGVQRYSNLASRHLDPPELEEVDGDTIALRTRTNQSRIEIALAARAWTCAEGRRAREHRRLHREEGAISHQIAVRLQEDESVSVEKIVSLYTSRDPAISEPATEARRALERAGTFRELLEAHVVHLDHAWQRLGVAIEGDERPSFILNLHLFHLMQTVSPHTVDLDVGVPARGLHGEAYRGHIFWDEIFVFPYLNLTMPELTRSLLRYRHRRLPEARWAARTEGFAGAMFPWQSGSDGREESQTLHLNPRSGRWLRDNSHLQRHINVAIAYNVWHYFQSTDDIEFLCTHGAEMLLEVARFLASIAEHDLARDRYVIRQVMGPDEYHDGYPWRREPGLDNNAYTNVMTVWVLLRALETLDALPGERRRSLWEELGLSRQELDRWEQITRRMFVPFQDAGIISQFEGYERLEELDWDDYRRRYGDIRRLDRILEAEGDTPNRYKASKQADVLMLFYLLSAGELERLFTGLGYEFSPRTIPDNIDYYMRRTSHGSTLSQLVHSWVLARADRPGSWELCIEALESDVADVQGGTTPEGIHLGAMAGTVDIVARGYSGIEPREGVLWLNPSLPDELDALTLSLRYRRHWGIRVRIADGRLQVRVPPSDAGSIMVGFRGSLIEVGAGETFDVPLSGVDPGGG